MSSTVVSIESEAENEFVQHILYKKNLDMFSGDCWIGLKVQDKGDKSGDAIGQLLNSF